MIEGHDILCLASQDWDSHLGVPQQIMARLADRNRVIYVNPPRSVLGAAGRALGGGAGGHVLHLDIVAATRVEVLDPPPLTAPIFNLPPALTPTLRQANGFVLGAWMRRVLAARGVRDPLLWIYGVAGCQMLGRVSARATIYDCIDEWAGYHAPGTPGWRNTVAMDEALCRGSDLVFAGSRHLGRLKAPLNPETHVIEHAADFRHFNCAADPRSAPASEIAALPKPVIGVMGMLDKRLDLDILGHLARSRPGWTLAIVGPVLANLDLGPLKGMPNVHLLGPRTVAEMPACIAGFDVCLIPYVIDGFTLNIYPLKLHEYLASGRPVVTTPIPACMEHGDLVGIADTREGFLAAVEAALRDRGPERDAARIAIARANTWEDRVVRKSDLVAALLARRAA